MEPRGQAEEGANVMSENGVSIWIIARPRAPKAKVIDYRYILAYKGKSRSGRGQVENQTYNQAVLTAAIKAMERMVSPTFITINTDCRYLVEGHKHIPEWIRNGWKRNNGQQLQNKELWKKLQDLESRHSIRCVEENVEMIFGKEEE